MTNQQDKMKLWDSVHRTDPVFTKENKQSGGSTSINTTYMFKRATETFGPIGIGWGYEVLEDKITEGAEKVHGTQENPMNYRESIHTLKIKFWYMLDGKRGEFEQYGHTDFVARTKYGPATESEPQKKSLSDAIKKSLSMLGFSSDIFMGLYDDQQYVQSVAADIQAEAAESQIDREAQKVVEYQEWVAEQTGLIDSATNMSALTLYKKKAIRVLAERLSHNRISKAQHDRGVVAIERSATDAAVKFEDQEKKS